MSAAGAGWWTAGKKTFLQSAECQGIYIRFARKTFQLIPQTSGGVARAEVWTNKR